MITWNDPSLTLEAARRLSGRQMLEAWMAGRLPPPPMARLLDFTLVEVGDGHVVFVGEPGEQHYNPIGSVHGGLAATLLDSAMGCAVHSQLPLGTRYATLELKINYIRAMTRTTGPVRAEASVIHLGGRIATAEGRLTGADGTLYAHGTTTCMLLRD
ncbi:MAG: PaaI family thioesterase [Ktedonobacterales bacterium]|nr:PaaI family thioesterase [Ktedonobacterales bacterium]